MKTEKCIQMEERTIHISQKVNFPHGDRVFVDDLNEELADALACASLLDIINRDLMNRIKEKKIACGENCLREEVEQSDNDSEDR